MYREIKKSGLSLALAGVVGVLYFWLTDPVWGLARRVHPAENPVDAMNEASIGTMVGVSASLVVLALGLWISMRKPT